MAHSTSVFAEVCKKFGLRELNNFQKEATDYFAFKGKDVFVNLPTGAGKSMIYLALPTVFDIIREQRGRIYHCSCVASN